MILNSAQKLVMLIDFFLDDLLGKKSKKKQQTQGSHNYTNTLILLCQKQLLNWTIDCTLSNCYRRGNDPKFLTWSMAEYVENTFIVTTRIMQQLLGFF